MTPPTRAPTGAAAAATAVAAASRPAATAHPVTTADAAVTPPTRAPTGAAAAAVSLSVAAVNAAAPRANRPYVGARRHLPWTRKSNGDRKSTNGEWMGSPGTFRG